MTDTRKTLPPHRFIERAILRQLIADLKVVGWTLKSFDFDEESVPVNTPEEAWSAYDEVDEGLFYFQKAGFKDSWVAFMGGNGEDCLHDYEVRDEDPTWGKAVDEAAERALAR